MTNIVLNIKKRSALQWFGELYCMILLFLPTEIIQLTSIYTKTTPAGFRYKYTSFYFSALLIPAILIALLIRKRTKAIRFDLVIIAIVIKDFLYLTFAKDLQLVEYNFSFNLILIASWSILTIVFAFCDKNNTESVELFLDNYLLLAILSQFLRLALRMSTNGRYGAIGLSVGGTGYFDAIFIVYCLYCRDFTNRVKILMFLAAISLVLSGQRSNLLFLLCFCVPYMVKSLRDRRLSKGESSKNIIIWLFAGLGIIVILLITTLNELGFEIKGFEFVTRTISAFENFVNGNIGNESSVEGRVLSLQAGFNVLKSNPLGITNNFYDLQYRTLLNSYPTFPHNTLLCCYLLWSPFVVIFCLICLFKLLFRAKKFEVGLFWPLLYIVIYNLVTGSVFLDYPYLFINLFFISLTKCKTDFLIEKGKHENAIK